MKRRRDAGLVEGLLLLAACLGGACAGEDPRPRPPNVLLICLDTVRADHLGTYGYPRPTTPALDALAARSLVFERASSTAGWTKPSVPSFLTGTHPARHGVYEGSAHDATGEVTDLLPDAALTLAEVFQQRGYATAAFVHNAQLRAGNGFEQGFARYEQENMDAREIRWRGLDWLDQRDGEEPFFLYLHFLDAHWPYPAPEEWFARFAPAQVTAPFRGKESKALYEAINDGTHALSEGEREALEALYDGALAYLDSELARLFAGLELRGLADDTIVCVLADHGEEFGEHGKVGHGHGLWENLLHVPWILHVPGRAPHRSRTLVSLVDLFPTLLSAAGLPVPADLEGVDRLREPDAARPILAEHKAPDQYQQSLRLGDEKLVRHFQAPAGKAAASWSLTLPLGTRWEAEFERDDALLVATQLKPRSEDQGEPVELKGPIGGLDAGGFHIAGIPVHYTGDTDRQTGTGTAGPELADGLVVKVRGAFVDGVLAAERIKFYASDESPQCEIRGPVASLAQEEGSARLVLGGVALQVTPATVLKDVAHSAQPRLSRFEIAELLEAGASSQAQQNGYESARALHDLIRDPRELAPRALERGSALEERLDELGAALARMRLFAAGDQRALDAQALRELQAIGYGD